jgi:DNA repair ATPase RecN
MEKYDKSLTEVWEWRKKVHENYKNLTAKEYVEKMRKDTDNALAKYGIELKRMESKKILQKAN